VPTDVRAPPGNYEDPPLHAKIDLLRDLFRAKQSYLFAKEGLLDLQAKEDLTDKPWAKFRIETNLGSISISQGKHEEAADHFEKAYAVRPTDCHAVANLALARTILGKYEEGMQLATSALNMSPRSDQAVSYLLQAAARTSWQGDPETLIPADLVGSVHADLGLVEFFRKRNIAGWAEKTRVLAHAHQDIEEFRRADAIAVLELALGSDIFIGAPGNVSREDLQRAANEMLAMADSCLLNDFSDLHDLLAYVNNAAVLLRITGRQADCESLLVRALPSLPDQPQLRRLPAMRRWCQINKIGEVVDRKHCGTDLGDNPPESTYDHRSLRESYRNSLLVGSKIVPVPYRDIAGILVDSILDCFDGFAARWPHRNGCGGVYVCQLF